jgi:hypothetical protein
VTLRCALGRSDGRFGVDIAWAEDAEDQRHERNRTLATDDSSGVIGIRPVADRVVRGTFDVHAEALRAASWLRRVPATLDAKTSCLIFSFFRVPSVLGIPAKTHCRMVDVPLRASIPFDTFQTVPSSNRTGARLPSDARSGSNIECKTTIDKNWLGRSAPTRNLVKLYAKKETSMDITIKDHLLPISVHLFLARTEIYVGINVC